MGKQMSDLQRLANSVQEAVKTLNELTKEMEGQGCTIKYTCSQPWNKIDFVQITKLTEFK